MHVYGCEQGVRFWLNTRGTAKCAFLIDFLWSKTHVHFANCAFPGWRGVYRVNFDTEWNFRGRILKICQPWAKTWNPHGKINVNLPQSEILVEEFLKNLGLPRVRSKMGNFFWRLFFFFEKKIFLERFFEIWFESLEKNGWGVI